MWGVPVIVLLVVILVNIVPQGSVAGFSWLNLPNIKLGKHTNDEIRSYLMRSATQQFNFPVNDFSNDSNLESLRGGYSLKSRSILLGHGIHCFQEASERLLSGRGASSLTWAQITTLPLNASVIKPEATIATLCQLYKSKFWALNPCRVISVVKPTKGKLSLAPANGKIITELAYGTVQGHLLSGIEKLRVIIVPLTEEVTFEIESYSRGNGLLGALSIPLIKPLQNQFMNDFCNAMCVP